MQKKEPNFLSDPIGYIIIVGVEMYWVAWCVVDYVIEFLTDLT